MSEQRDNTTENDLDIPVAELIDRLVATNEVKFNEAGLLDITLMDLDSINYQAICEGFGFTADFEVPYHNTLSDDLENEQPGFLKVLDTLGVRDPHTYYECHFTKQTLVSAIRYWYALGYWARSVGGKFPYSDGVTAEEFMSLSREQQQLLFESD